MTPPLVHDAFYRFVALPDPEAVAARLRVLSRAITGSILVAAEGINGTVAGSESALADFRAALATDALFEGRFAGMAFKRSACRTPPFGRMRVHVKPEIVALGFAHPPVEMAAGTHVSPQAWRELITRDDVVVIDNRNSFEYRLGRFNGAIDPGVSHFRDFPQFIAEHAAQWQAQGQQVAMYCTGGIRCEKTAAWMQQTHGLDVWQLDGGILNHFQSLPDASRDWVGECFVFDNRMALDTHLQETGTQAEQVFAGEPDAEWRIARARRLADAV